MGGSAPKFSTDLTTSGVRRSSKAAFSLSCPAQGSPVPAYRLYLELILSYFSSLEPVGGSSPKFSTDVTRSDVQRSAFASLSLSCPAQGSPVPAFRLLLSQNQWVARSQNFPLQTKPPFFPPSSEILSAFCVLPKDHLFQDIGVTSLSVFYFFTMKQRKSWTQRSRS